MKSSSLAVLFLILVNFIPIFGVLFLDWGLFSMLVLYWLENLIIGIFNIIKMAFASKSFTEADIQRLNPDVKIGSETTLKFMNIALKLFMIPSFMLHYGIFCFVHCMIIVTFFGESEGFGGSDSLSLPIETPLSDPVTLGTAFGWALLSMVLSHGLSLVLNYFGQKEYKQMSVLEQMIQPYKRVVILHITVLIGAFLIMMMGSPILALVLMAMLKIVVDIWAHLKEHNKLQRKGLATV